MDLVRIVRERWRGLGLVYKFAWTLGLFAALIIFVAAVGLHSLQSLEQSADSIVSRSLRAQELALNTIGELKRARHAEQECRALWSMQGEPGLFADHKIAFFDCMVQAENNLEHLAAIKGCPDNQLLAALVRNLNGRVQEYGDAFRNLFRQRARPELEHAEIDSRYARVFALANRLSQVAAEEAMLARAHIASTSSATRIVFCVAVLAALLMAAFIGTLLHNVARNAVRLTRAATEFGQGNLRARAEVDSDDEFGRLADSLNSMAGRMALLVQRLETETARATARLRDAIDSISEGFVLYDEQDRLVMINRRVMEFIDARLPDLRYGMGLGTIAETLAESGMFTNAQGREGVWAEDHVLKHRKPGGPFLEPLEDGRWLQYRHYKTGNGETVVLIADVTETKRAEECLASMNADLEHLVRERTRVLLEKTRELRKANSRLKELDSLKSAFLSSVSHELRTPLASILGFSRIIRRDFDRHFDPLAAQGVTRRYGARIQSNLDIIACEGERLTRLINDVLDLSRIEAGKEHWRDGIVNPVDAVRRAADSAQGLFSGKRGVELRVTCPEVMPDLRMDSDRLQQVLINLLSNAAKFTEYGTVTLSTEAGEPGEVLFTVADTGSGIAPEYLDCIFDNFQQVCAGNVLQDKPQGTGLGLAICRQIVEHYRGTIRAESRLGRGTLLTVSLPEAGSEARPCVLIADADETTSHYLSILLEKDGCDVLLAGKGPEALELAARHLPDLVVLDPRLPGMSGEGIVRQMRAEHELAGMPILLVSVPEALQGSGANLCLAKPLDSECFLDAVHVLLHGALLDRDVLVHSDCWRTVRALCPAQSGPYSEAGLRAEMAGGFSGAVLVPDRFFEDGEFVRLCRRNGVRIMALPNEAPRVAGLATVEPVA